MKKFGLALIAAFALSSTQAMAVPVTDYIEGTGGTGDASGSLITPQDAGADITSITGTIGTAGDDYEDLFSFSWSGGLFDATSVSSLNTMLFLFQSDGTLIDANIIYENLVAADYLLGISLSGNNAMLDAGKLSYWDRDGTRGTSPTSSYKININSAQVPEPAPLALLALGLTAIGLARRKAR